MGTSIRRTVLWLVLAALSIAAAAWLATGVSADAGAQPTGGSVKVIKPASTQGTFIFEISCSPSNLSYAPEFPTDFNGANWESANEIPDGDNCTVTETFPNGDADAWIVEHKVEGNDPGTGQFQPGPTGVVPIDGLSTNTIRYKNDPKPVEATKITIAKIQVGGPANTEFKFTLQCDMKPYPDVTLTGTSKKTIDVPAEAEQCNVTEVAADSPGGLTVWTTTPGLSITKPLVDDEIALFEFTNTYIEDPEPETGSLKIIKQPTPGNADGPWLFTWVCDDKAGTSGTAAYPDDFAPGKEFDVPGDIALGTDCTVTETFPNLDAASWDTSYQIEGGPFTAGTVAIVPIKNTGTNTVKFKNDFIEPEPETASVWVTKKFEGPDDWEFGFAFICSYYGNADTFVLGGGESVHFEIPFFKQQVLATEENGEHEGLVCGVAEEALSGGWTVNVSVAGASDYKMETEGEASALFLVYPGDAITVTFENIPGYGAQPPTGIPPVLATDVS